MAENAADNTAESNETPAALTPLPDGTVLEYALADSGMDFPALGLFLSPASDGIVGEDMDGALAARFVDAGILRVVQAPQDEEETQEETETQNEQEAGPVNQQEAGPVNQAAAPAQPPPAPPASLPSPAPEGPPANQGEAEQASEASDDAETHDA